MTPEEQKEFNELSAFVKANGFMKLDTHEKRVRYRELKAQSKYQTEEVSITKAKLQEMVNDAAKNMMEQYKAEMSEKQQNVEGLEEVMKLNQWMKAQKPKKKNKMAKLRVFREDGMADGGIIIDWKFLKNAFNEETRRNDIPIYHIWVKYDGEVKEYDIPLLQMVEINEFEDVEIIKENIEEQEMTHGTGQRAHTSKSGYRFSNPGYFGVNPQQSGETFDFIVTRKEITCTIKRPNGKTLDIHSSRLNQ